MTDWFLGTMGFGYKDWVGTFYPDGLATSKFLSYYSRSFNSVELDTTFHGVPKTSKIKQWREAVPEEFKFCAKLPRQITHEKRLKDVAGELDEFIDAMRLLEKKLGVLLIQLPPSFTASEEKTFGKFLELLPRDIRFSVEFRHGSWENSNIATVLRAHGICWATIEFPGLKNWVKETCDFLYLRWIGQHGTYDRHTFERTDKTSQLTWWKDQIQLLVDRVGSVYGFFNNDYAGFAIGTCLKFKEVMGMSKDTNQLIQGRLF